MVVFDITTGTHPLAHRHLRVMTRAGVAFSRDPPRYGFQAYYTVLPWQKAEFERITPEAIQNAWISTSGNLLIRTSVNGVGTIFILDVHHAPLLGL